jgi:hypothetical protein
MQTSEAEEQLRMMLVAAGFDGQNPEPSVAWETFKSFVREPFDCADDGVLFECGVFNFTGEDLFYLEFVRQFSFDDDAGEYERMEQLHCTFTRLPTAELFTIQKNLWAYEFASLDEYFAAIENLQEFHIAMSQSQWKFELKQGEV